MSASYPSSVKSFSTKTSGQTVASAHMNDVQDEVVALEGALVNGIAHTLKPDGDATRDLGASASKWAHVFVGSGLVGTPSVAVGDSDVGLYSSGTNALDVATNGVKALGIDSTQFVDSPTQPRCSAFNSAAQSHNSSGSWLAVTFDSEDFDIGSMHDTSSTTDRITIPTGGDGLYLLMGQICWAASVTNLRGARFTKNGTAFLMNTFQQGQSSSGVGPTTNIIGLAVLAAADIVRMEGFQDSGGNLNMGSATTQLANRLQVVKLW